MDTLEAATSLGDEGKVLESVKRYYGKTLKTTADLKGAACLTGSAPPPRVRELLRNVPEEVVSKYYGCGSPLPLGIDGLRVLDLGCGSGRDCYVCAALVGPTGSVTGLDMTPELLEVARRHAGDYATKTLGYQASNLRFVEGRIEKLGEAGIAEGSVDLIISNCVVNLSPDKAAVLREAYRALAPGGEMHFSDVYADRRLPPEARQHPVLLGECVGGVLYVGDFLRLARLAGFQDPRQLSARAIETSDYAELMADCPELQRLLGGTRFYSITYRLFKVPELIEPACEDYGQAVRYKGTLPGSPAAYQLDEFHAFQAGKWHEACGNTAAMLGATWLARHFEVAGDRSVHYGAYRAGLPPTASGDTPATATAAAAGAGTGGCCGGCA